MCMGYGIEGKREQLSKPSRIAKRGQLSKTIKNSQAWWHMPFIPVDICTVNLRSARGYREKLFFKRGKVLKVFLYNILFCYLSSTSFISKNGLK